MCGSWLCVVSQEAEMSVVAQLAFRSLPLIQSTALAHEILLACTQGRLPHQFLFSGNTLTEQG